MYVRPISTRLLRGMLTPEILAIDGSSRDGGLALPLLVTGVRTDHEHPTVAADDLALLAHRLDRGSYLHAEFTLSIGNTLRLISPLRLWRPVQSPLPRRKARAARKHHAAGAPGDVSTGAQAAARPLPASCHGVSTRGPSAVIAIVNSKWAASDPSWEKIDHRSSATRTAWRPAVTIGSTASTIPSSSGMPEPAVP